MPIPDENDWLQAGTLPDDPLEGATPMLSETATELESQRVGHWLSTAMDRLGARGRGEELPITTPWRSFNEAMAGGVWPGLHVLVGGTGTGKSQWALQLALHAALAGTPVLYVGLELGELDLAARLVGLISKRKWSRLFLGRDGAGAVSDQELREIERDHGEALGRLARAPCYAEFPPPHGWSYDRLYARVEAMRQLHPEIGQNAPVLVVLDFLQLVSSPAAGPGEDVRERIGKAAYAARATARQLNAAVLVLSSTARANYGTVAPAEAEQKTAQKTARPPASSLVGSGKETGEIEYAADSVLVFVRRAGESAGAWSEIDVAVAKARATTEALRATDGWLKLRFNGGWFEDLVSNSTHEEVWR